MENNQNLHFRTNIGSTANLEAFDNAEMRWYEMKWNDKT